MPEGPAHVGNLAPVIRAFRIAHQSILEVALEFMLESLQSNLDEPWKPVSRPALVAWVIFYLGFMFYAFSAHGGFLFIDSANLVVHEGGHNLFSWFGPTLCL